MKTTRPHSVCHFILMIVTLSALTCSVFADMNEKVFTRPIMLEDMARNCIIRGVMEISTNADELDNAARHLADTPSRKTLDQTQQAWIKMQLSYKRHEMLSYGPIEGQVFWSANFYRRPFPGAVEYIVRGGQPIDKNLIERIGAPAKGFSAAEYLLFNPSLAQAGKGGFNEKIRTNSPVSWLLEGETAARRRMYLCEVSANLKRQLLNAAQAAQDKDFPAKFAAGAGVIFCL